jgi:hypothetical protein
MDIEHTISASITKKKVFPLIIKTWRIHP